MNERQTFHAAAMMRTGIHGHFASAIGDAYTYADERNRARLLAAFPELFAKVHDFHKPQLEIISHD